MYLNDWMKKNKVSNRDMSKITKLHYSTISKYRTGDRTPSIHDALKIEKATGGLVKVESFDPSSKRK